ncbi:hypothetical protein B0H17DRAFT_1136547 [Mycena rosella]|uniref:Uncharacterized protein n=1 Tax=Mycena rosella TaxID=1033263 RepID=A0AAD7GGJ6_MYCRO|nr:hypothetical protein B0H17DRAFT_1136547 [Mycena rosella]
MHTPESSASRPPARPTRTPPLRASPARFTRHPCPRPSWSQARGDGGGGRRHMCIDLPVRRNARALEPCGVSAAGWRAMAGEGANASGVEGPPQSHVAERVERARELGHWGVLGTGCSTGKADACR